MRKMRDFDNQAFNIHRVYVKIPRRIRWSKPRVSVSDFEVARVVLVALMLAAALVGWQQSQRPALPPAPAMAQVKLPAWEAESTPLAPSPTPIPPTPVVTVLEPVGASTPPITYEVNITDTLSARQVRQPPQAIIMPDGTEVRVTQAHLDVNTEYRWQIPDWEAGWHTDSQDCGAGTTIIGGHIVWRGKAGVFALLHAVGPGDRIVCVDSAGQPHTYLPVDYVLSSVDAHNTTEWDDSMEHYTDYMEQVVERLENPPVLSAEIVEELQGLVFRNDNKLLLYTCTPESDDDELVVIRFVEVVPMVRDIP